MYCQLITINHNGFVSKDISCELRTHNARCQRERDHSVKDVFFLKTYKNYKKGLENLIIILLCIFFLDCCLPFSLYYSLPTLKVR